MLLPSKDVRPYPNGQAIASLRVLERGAHNIASQETITLDVL